MTGTCDLDSNSSCGDDSSYSAVVNATEVVSGSLGEPRGGGGDLPINQCPHLSGMVTRPVYPNFGKLDVPEASWREVEDDMAHPLCSPRPVVGDGPGHPSRGDDLFEEPAAAGTLPVKDACVQNCCPACPNPSTCPTVPATIYSITWFRKADNNPIVIDNTVIDSSTFTRSLSNLPANQNYGANANVAISSYLYGHPDTQNVMYSGIPPQARYLGLTADDVNMLRNAEVGPDRTANTADDYTVQLAYVSDCSTAQVEAFWDVTLTGNVLGQCDLNARIVQSFAQSGFLTHFTLAPASGQPSLLLTFNPNRTWDYGIPITFSNFEQGDLPSEWSAVFP